MKRTFFRLALLFVIVCFAACNTSLEIELNTSSVKSADFVRPKQQNKADSLHAAIKDCAKNQGCGIDDDFCNKAGCLDVIVKCHTIDSLTFDTLTNFEAERSKQFTPTQVMNILNSTDCKTQKIRCYRHKNFWGKYYYRIGPVPIDQTAAPDGKDSYSYYSRPLLDSINRRKLNYIILYNAIITSDNMAIVPIKAFFQDGTTGCYDLSNDFP